MSYECNKSPLLLPVVIVEAQSTELTVRERNISFELVLIANTTSEFDYNVTMDSTDISTGECVHFCTCTTVFTVHDVSTLTHHTYIHTYKFKGDGNSMLKVIRLCIHMAQVIHAYLSVICILSVTVVCNSLVYLHGSLYPAS